MGPGLFEAGVVVLWRLAEMVSLVAGGRVPLAFIGLGLALYTLSIGLVTGDGHLLGSALIAPKAVALAHLWLPGFLLSVCLGASYQLMPVVMGRELPVGERGLWIRFGLQGLGVPLLVVGLWSGLYGLAAVGGVVLAGGSVLFAWTAWRTFVSSDRRDAAAWAFPLAGAWLAVTTVFGVLLACNRTGGFLPLGILDLLKAHAHVGFVGFFASLTQGVMFELVPMFTMAEFRGRRLALGGLFSSQVGLLFLAPGLAFGYEVIVLFGALATGFLILPKKIRT